jgi:cytochrome b561
MNNPDHKNIPLRYNSMAIILHWLMAIGFCAMFGSGIIMTYADIEKSLQFNMYQWHKSGGVLLLLAFIMRISWRLISYKLDQIPPLPSSFSRPEIIAAKLGHWMLYILMIAMPISGWVMVSASVYGLPTIVFGWFEWPHVPNLQGNEGVEGLAKEAHFYLAILFGFAIATHIAAVIKHAMIDKLNLMPRIWWCKTKGN